MTVQELIQELEQFDPNTEICVRTGNRSYQRTDIYFEPEEVWAYGGTETVLMMQGDF